MKPLTVIISHTFVCKLAPVFLLVSTALSAPEILRNVNNNNFTTQQNDENFNSTKHIPSLNISHLNWQILDKLSFEDGVALENYKAPYDIPKRYMYYLGGYNHENLPIWIIKGSEWDIVEGVRKAQTAELEIYFMQMAQRFIKSIPARSTPDNPVTKAVFLVDFADLQYRQVIHLPTVTFATGMLSAAAHLIEKYVGGAYVVNANFATRILVNIVRPFLEGIFSKVFVYGNDKAIWMPEILKVFPKNSIPAWYGGEKGYKPVEVYG
ncbi:unnamed protein product [Allacma fusca]|uniref:CRAL-TRIO domain-containing protein n=1 Tax=Allacma fusca TaxID=39272 RepID=A0A8J2P1W9_9HEXA|nr:unnamed protein product [Allacma fusca]